MTSTREKDESLWWLAASPAIWAAHFLACYITVAIWCEKVAAPGGPLGSARIAVVAYTGVALALVITIGVRGWRRHRHGAGEPPHDEDTPEDRHRFLGFSTLLLSGLSAVAIAWGALPAAFVGTCR